MKKINLICEILGWLFLPVLLLPLALIITLVLFIGYCMNVALNIPFAKRKKNYITIHTPPNSEPPKLSRGGTGVGK